MIIRCNGLRFIEAVLFNYWVSLLRVSSYLIAAIEA
jgi:hypothetical protein